MKASLSLIYTHTLSKDTFLFLQGLGCVWETFFNLLPKLAD